MIVDAIIVAAGQGRRARGHGDTIPKQYRDVGGVPMLQRSVEALAVIEDIRRIAVVISPDHHPFYEALSLSDHQILPPVAGGAERDQSVRAGLAALASDPPDIVLIHDAARPFVSPALVNAVIRSAHAVGGAVPCLPIVDTVKRIAENETIEATLDRNRLGLAQTPQGFHYGDIRLAHQRAAKSGEAFTDDASVAEWAGLAVVAIPGDPANRKITNMEDFDVSTASGAMTVRVGQGFDVHAFADGSAVVLGGVAIPHDRALSGHSDADVLLHTITDALLGALADGDIGSHFPPSEPRWKGVASDRFLIHACTLCRDRGGVIDHVDATVICETPKVGPHRDALRANIARIMALEVCQVSVKATTSERLGFTGRREGIAAMATVTIRLPA